MIYYDSAAPVLPLDVFTQIIAPGARTTSASNRPCLLQVMARDLFHSDVAGGLTVLTLTHQAIQRLVSIEIPVKERVTGIAMNPE